MFYKSSPEGTFIDFKNRESKRQRETSIVCLPHTPDQESNPQPRLCALSWDQAHNLFFFFFFGVQDDIATN